MVTTHGAGQLRPVDTPDGPLTYILQKKRIKNLNLRIRADMTVVLSVPMRCSGERADSFVREKSDWIVQSLTRMRQAQQQEIPPEPTRDECRDILLRSVVRVWPCVKPLGVVMPELKLRRMRSQWGNCHWRQGYITLNMALARCPEELQDYVALHELVHFLYHDHGAQFHGMMDQLMPDWRERRQRLRNYGAALVPQENKER